MRIQRQQAGTEGIPLFLSWRTRSDVRQLVPLSFATHSQEIRNSSPPLPSWKKRTTQRATTQWPEPPNGNSRGPPASPRRLVGGGHPAQDSPSLPPRTSAAGPTAGPGLRSRTARASEKRSRGRRPPPPARRCPTPRRRPHLRRLLGTRDRARGQAGRTKLLTGKARPPGARTGSQRRSPAPGPLSAAR